MKTNPFERFSFSIIFIIAYTSCATIMKNDKYPLTVSSPQVGAKLQFNDSIYQLPSSIEVYRTRYPLELTLLSDSVSKDFILKSRPSPAFLFGNLCFLYGAPLGYLFDYASGKAFYYGHSISLDASKPDRSEKKAKGKYTKMVEDRHSKTVIYAAWFDDSSKMWPAKKHQLNMVFSIPVLNAFYLRPQVISPQSDIGFYGLSGGLDYFYSNTRFVSLKYTNAISLFSVMIGPDFPTTNFKSFYADLCDNVTLKGFSLGYGVHVAQTNWQRSRYDFGNYTDNENGEVNVFTNRSIGFTFSGYYQLSQQFFIGLAYKPSVYTFYPESRFNYGHVISLDLAYKMRLFK